MPKREDETLQRVLYGGHPPTCTCTVCTRRRLRRGRMSWVAVLLLLLVLLGLAIIAYTLYHSEQVGQAALIGITLTTVVITIWNIREVRWLWKYRPRRAAFGRVFASLILVAMIACSAAAFTGVAPFSELKEQVVEYFANLSEEAKTEDTAGSSSAMTSARSGVEPFDSKQPPYSKTFGAPIHLTNNSSATDPTWQQLMSFLVADKTDQKDYSAFSFPCGAFAEEVHNNAEAAGIQAAWVAVDFEDNTDGHALNAFNTTDRGLVYVDCTGRDVLIVVPVVPPSGVEQKIFGGANSWDKIAYIEIGKEYGIINVEVVSSFTYTYYEQCKQRLQAFKAMLEDYNQKVTAFNLEVEKYNDWLGGRILYEGTSEALRAEQWHNELSRQENILKGIEEELEREGNSLGAFWEPLGIVKSVEIYW